MQILMKMLVVTLASAGSMRAQHPLNPAKNAPEITHISWGKILVHEGEKNTQYKDAKVWTAKACTWDWKKTGTLHDPGVQIADIEEFMNEVDEVILTRGMDLVLQVPHETIDFVRKMGKKCHVGQTEDMVKLYNELTKQGKKVGGVFHSTC